MAKNNPLIGGAKIIVIVGPTASGKSDLAVRLAIKLARHKPKKVAEIISADSRQVYRGMNIGTGKITKKEMRGVPHHLLDVVSPKSEFNVSHFKKLAIKKIKEILKRGHIPIIVGGAGFWIDALIYDWPIPEVRANRALRARLEKWPAARLFTKLQKFDPNRAASIKARNETNNKRRLIRALEIVMESGKPSPESPLLIYYDRDKLEVTIGGKKYRILLLGIKLPQKELEKRIRKRLVRRLKSGMINEIRKLHHRGVSWKRLDNFGLEYRYISRYLRGLISYDEMLEQLYRAIKNYAKRQMKWFKRNTNIHWTSNSREALSLVEQFILRDF